MNEFCIKFNVNVVNWLARRHTLSVYRRFHVYLYADMYTCVCTYACMLIYSYQDGVTHIHTYTCEKGNILYACTDNVSQFIHEDI
jgi:hypothetical protein